MPFPIELLRFFESATGTPARQPAPDRAADADPAQLPAASGGATADGIANGDRPQPVTTDRAADRP
jgi:hypothetical protein